MASTAIRCFLREETDNNITHSPYLHAIMATAVGSFSRRKIAMARRDQLSLVMTSSFYSNPALFRNTIVTSSLSSSSLFKISSYIISNTS